MYGSKIGSVMQTSTPPTAVDIAMTPWKVIMAAKSMRRPVSLVTVSTVQESPP